ACRRDEIACGVTGGTSTIDAVLGILKLGLHSGMSLQISDSDHFIGEPPAMRSAVILFQTCIDGAIFRAVAAHALKSYPADHDVAVVQARNWNEGKVRWCKLGKLVSRFPRPPLYATLVIPPVPSSLVREQGAPAKPRVLLIGLGFPENDGLTEEVSEAIKSCKVIFGGSSLSKVFHDLGSKFRTVAHFGTD